MAKKWWEYIAEPAGDLLAGDVVGAVTGPLFGLMGLGQQAPQMPQMPAPNRLAEALARQEETRRRQQQALMAQPRQQIYSPNQDVLAALRTIRERWS